MKLQKISNNKKNTIILLFLTSLLYIFPASAQTNFFATYIGDTAILAVPTYRGSIQWEQSTDSLNWANISAATSRKITVITIFTSTGKKYFRAKISDTLCPLAITYSNVIQHRIITSDTQVQIGNGFKGGIVFYISSPGHGLIVTPEDQIPYSKWGCDGTSITGARSDSNGLANTAAILAGCSARPIAASICDSLTFNGYSDWFLPSINQLNLLYQQRYAVGKNWFRFYLSSTEHDNTSAWAGDYSYPHTFKTWEMPKITATVYRCIRLF